MNAQTSTQSYQNSIDSLENVADSLPNPFVIPEGVDKVNLLRRANIVFAERDSYLSQRDSLRILVAVKDSIIAENELQLTFKDSIIVKNEAIIKNQDRKELLALNKKEGEVKEMKRQRDKARGRNLIYIIISVSLVVATALLK